MRAVVLEQFGPPENLVLREVPDPAPGPGEVLISVAAAGVTFIETVIRAGRGWSAAQRPPLPFVPGNGVAGTVDGRRVVSTTGGSGGYAELVAVPAPAPLPVPDGLDLTEAVALLADGRTAVGLAGAVRPQPGEWVLVEAAGGGVGSLLVQLAARAGSRVIAAAGGARKLDLAASLGAEVTVDYAAPGWEGRVRAATGGHGPDAVFDSVGGEIGRTALTLVRDGGRFCVMGAASGSMTVAPDGEVAQRRLRMIGLGDVLGTPEAVRDATSIALAEGAAGRLRPTIGQTFPLDRAPDAHAAIEARATIGKTVLLP